VAKHKTKWKVFKPSKRVVESTLIADHSLSALTHYLNEASRSADAAKAVRLVEVMQEIETLEEPFWGETQEERNLSLGVNPHLFIISTRGKWQPDPRHCSIAPQKFWQQAEIETRRAFIDRELARQSFIPRVWRSSLGQWYVRWDTKSKGWRRVRRTAGNTFVMTKGGAIQTILTIATAGQLRQCERCSRWMYVNFKHQHFCSTKCQQRDYADSPRWRKKRREYMRKYRKHINRQ
jgi:hypothetical protein